MTPEERSRQLRRAAAAAAIGTAIELYDFFLYGVAAALVFPQRFFPSSDHATGTLLSFSTFFVGFAARPIGAAIFGHFGDRIGRKATLVATLSLMGAATAGIGLVPGYATIGPWGAVLLTLGRVLQGIGVGGEWGGSVLLATEWGESRRRGFIGSLPQSGVPIGLLLANGALMLAARWTGDAFAEWGWRIPFLASLLLVGVGLYIRAGIGETPAFVRVRDSGRVARAPVLEALRTNGRAIALIALVRTGEQISFYVFTTFILSYATGTLGFSRGRALTDVMIAAAASVLAIPLFGLLADRIGRRRLLAFGCVAMLVWPFAYFGLLDTRNEWLALVAIVAAQLIHDIQFSPQAAVIAESFPGPHRYSGVSLGFQLASITAGGPTPFIALWLLQRSGTSFAVAAYLSAASLLSLIAMTRLARQPVFEVEQ